MSGGGVIKVGGASYAVGLYWQPVAMKEAARTAREAATAPGQDAQFFCIRPPTAGNPEVAQYGLGQKEMGHRWRMPSAAAAAAASVAAASPRGGNWAGCWKLREGWLVIVVRDFLIEARGDVLYADEDEARERLETEKAKGGLTKIFAPEEWRLANVDTAPLPLVLSTGGKSVTLQPTGGFTLVVIGGAAAAAILVGIGWGVFSMFGGAALLSDGKQVARQVHQMSNPPPPPPKRLWEDRPAPSLVLAECRRTLDQVPAGAVGMALTSVECGAQGAVFRWTRTRGRALLPAGGKLDDQGQVATVERGYAPMDKRGAQDLWAPEKVNDYLIRLPWKVGIGVLPEPPPDPNTAPAPWRRRSVNIQLVGAPWAVGPVLDAVPGLVINTTKWAGKSEGWVVEAIIYEARS